MKNYIIHYRRGLHDNRTRFGRQLAASLEAAMDEFAARHPGWVVIGAVDPDKVEDSPYYRNVLSEN